jgi:hypothetical protein
MPTKTSATGSKTGRTVAIVLTLLSAVSAVISIFVFLTGKDSIQSFRAHNSNAPVIRQDLPPIVGLYALTDEPRHFVNQRTRVEDVFLINGLGRLGKRAFVAPTSDPPFLFVFASDTHVPVFPRDSLLSERMDLTGTVQYVTPLVLNEWVSSGVLSEGMKDIAARFNYYFLVDAAHPSEQRS